MHQLQFMKDEILGRVRELSGTEEVRSLRFCIGEIPPSPPGGAQALPLDPAFPPLAERDRSMMRESLETVRDPELRMILERVMTREIGRRREREKQRGPGR